MNLSVLKYYCALSVKKSALFLLDSRRFYWGFSSCLCDIFLYPIHTLDNLHDLIFVHSWGKRTAGSFSYRISLIYGFCCTLWNFSRMEVQGHIFRKFEITFHVCFTNHIWHLWFVNCDSQFSIHKSHFTFHISECEL